MFDNVVTSSIYHVAETDMTTRDRSSDEAVFAPASRHGRSNGIRRVVGLLKKVAQFAGVSMKQSLLDLGKRGVPASLGMGPRRALRAPTPPRLRGSAVKRLLWTSEMGELLRKQNQQS